MKEKTILTFKKVLVPLNQKSLLDLEKEVEVRERVLSVRFKVAF
jgi:hypothetical protein